MSEKLIKLLIAIVLIIFGITAIVSYQLILSLILNAALIVAFVTGALRIWQGIVSKNAIEILIGVVSLFFGTILLFYSFIPEWLIRVCFGLYSVFVGASMLIQQGIYLYNETKTPVYGWIFSCAYSILGFLLLFSPSITTKLLMQFFGVYFLLLALRYLIDIFDSENTHYQWHRFIHVSAPTALSALIPDYYLNQINRLLQQNKPVPTEQIKSDEKPILRAMVHVGPEGFQKVGHFSFAYKDTVYSYGNYDSESFKLFGLLGDGVYFKVPFQKYLNNIRKYENNTIFEYGIHITEKQQEIIEKTLQELDNQSYRWYCQLEKLGVPYNESRLEKDYPCRLHYRTGAKFYKLKRGRFKTYWVTGENCVMFADQILGEIGADVLSVRGIVTPGTYFDYLQNEYAKPNSPVISCIIHPSFQDQIIQEEFKSQQTISDQAEPDQTKQ